MAKNYILEPTEVEFTEDEGLSGVIDFESYESMPNVEDTVYKCCFEIGGHKYYGDFSHYDESTADPYLFVKESDYPADIETYDLESNPGVELDIDVNALREEFKFDLLVDNTDLSAGTYTVSIYTGEDDSTPSGNGLPDMNVTYEFANTAKNDIEDIIQAIYINLNEDEAQAPGHSPADRLVIAVAKLNNVDPDTALYTGGYPNHMKRIAAIIRGDFE